MIKKIALLPMIPVFVLSYSSQSLATGAADGRAPSVVANPGTKGTADTAKKDNNSGSQVGQMISQGFMMAGVKAAAACPHNPGACAIAPVMFALSALAGKQSKANKNTAGQAAYAGYDTDGSGNYGYGDFAYDPYGNGNGADGLLGDSNGDRSGPGNGLIKAGDLEAYKKSLAQLTSKNGVNGFKFDPKKGVIITPDGKQIPVEQFDSQEGMKKAGMTDAQIKATMDKASKLEQEALAKVGVITGISEDGGGASGGGALAGSGAGDDELGGGSGHGSAGKLNNRDPASSKMAAGLSKDFNGEPIGVAQDGLFLMMSRRYKVKEKQDSFFTDAELIQK